MTEQKLGPFPVDAETLNVVYDAASRVMTVDDDGAIVVHSGSPFGLDDVLNMLSGYDPQQVVQMVNEYDQPIPDWFEYVGGQVYSPNDLIRALIDEIRSLRAAGFSPNPEGQAQR